jgi:urea transporter
MSVAICRCSIRVWYLQQIDHLGLILTASIVVFNCVVVLAAVCGCVLSHCAGSIVGTSSDRIKASLT